MNINTNYYDSTYYSQQTTHKRRQPITSHIDKDGDKTLSADELSAFTSEYSQKTGNSLDLSSIMSTYDSDSNGSLSESEQESMNKARALEQMMASVNQFREMKKMEPKSISNIIDEDGDDIWSTEELTLFVDMLNKATGSETDVESLLSKYDTDSDGSLNQTEQAQMMKDMAPPPINNTGFPFASINSDNTENSTSSVDSVGNIADEYNELREKINEIYSKMEELLEMKKTELNLINDIKDDARLTKLAFQNFAAKTNDTYEKSFWYENNYSSNVQYNA